ncbi:hypothetical protein BUALT_Bualt18G0039300 [Buddleja alternifolia]|uniref:Protein FLX-like 1 n=1 Tax=Buddleja alternifolia TaxID=168488 RepID=A0AAV6W3D2_9LAMI|nr:hypothetical protein BUALT_Bualt18G0039300 [Buddleja alternifolia]
MSARDRGPPFPTIGGPPHGGPPQPTAHEPPFARGLVGMRHPAFLEGMREAHYSLSGPGPGPSPRQLPPHPVIIDERLAAQHDDIQLLLVDNQGLAATHVALRQELEVAQYEFQRADKYAHTLHAEKDLQMRELYEKSIKIENELHAVNATRSELMQVHMDIKELTAARQDLTAQVQMMTQDLGRVTSDLQQVPAIKAEIEGLRHELERARAAIEHEKKGFAESFDHGKIMESKLISMAREMEKLRAELANAEKRAHPTTAVGNQGSNYNAYYGNPESGYPYPVRYGMTPTNATHQAPPGAESYPQYGPGPGAQGYPPQYGHGPGAWGSYDTQQAQGPR